VITFYIFARHCSSSKCDLELAGQVHSSANGSEEVLFQQRNSPVNEGRTRRSRRQHSWRQQEHYVLCLLEDNLKSEPEIRAALAVFAYNLLESHSEQA
jgi:hypothetical protein